MSLNQSRQGKIYYSTTPAVNNIADLATRQPATADSAANFYDRYRTISGYLYSELTADLTTAPGNIFVLGCNEVTLQPIGSAGTITVKGSLDGTTFVNANLTTSADGFIRIQSRYKWLQVTTASSSGTYSIYFTIS